MLLRCRCVSFLLTVAEEAFPMESGCMGSSSKAKGDHRVNCSRLQVCACGGTSHQLLPGGGGHCVSEVRRRWAQQVLGAGGGGAGAGGDGRAKGHFVHWKGSGGSNSEQSLSAWGMSRRGLVLARGSKRLLLQFAFWEGEVTMTANTASCCPLL